MDTREQELMELLIQLETITKRSVMGRFHSRHMMMNPHRGQGRVMSLLKLQPEISQKQLGYLLDISKQALAELLSKLEAAGYIVRTASNEDGRVMMIKLTEEGKNVAQEINQKEEKSNTIFSCLNIEEQEILKGYLQKMIENADDQVLDGFSRRHGRMFNRHDTL